MNKKKILIVDDEPDILEFLSYNFQKKEFNVCTAKNGVEGIRVAEAELPDIIISDILMPEMSGIEMCKEIRKKSKLDQTPILFLTAIHDEYQFMHAMHSGADQYFLKPIRFDYLLSLVNQLINEKQIRKNHYFDLVEKTMKNVLLVFDNPQELDFIEYNLSENGFRVFKTTNLKEAFKKAEEIVPDLIVVNTLDTEKDMELFSKLLATERLENVLLLCLIELEDYLNASSTKHLVVKPVRPKLLLSLIRGIMNHEKINWLPTLHSI